MTVRFMLQKQREENNPSLIKEDISAILRDRHSVMNYCYQQE